MPRGQYDRSAAKARRAAEADSAVDGGTVLESAPVAQPGTDAHVELAFWGSVQNSKLIADLEEYLERFPNGNFASLAERRIKQLIAAETHGGDPEDYKPSFAKKLAVNLPKIPMPEIGSENPKYQLLAPFFAEDNTFYPEGKEIEYLGPPNEHMYPLNNAGKAAKREQEEYLDACWAVKLKVEGKPLIPRPKEMADQIEAERNALRAQTGVVTTDDLPPSRPDMAQGGVRRDPRAGRIGKVTEGTAFKDRPANAPLLGRDGHRYQRTVDPANPRDHAV